MKLLSLLVLTTFISTTSYAAYTGPNSTKNSVKGSAKAVLSAPDDTKMHLEGKVINRIKKDKYTFQDSTGTIIVEIDNDKMRNITFDENTNVILYGEVDDNFNKDNEFEVDFIEIVK